MEITAAHGVTIAIGDDASPEVFTDIIGVHNGPNGPGFAPQMISARHHGSEDTFMKVSTIEKTPVTFDIYYDSSDAQHAALITASKNGTRKTFEITLTDSGAEVYTFEAFIQATYSGQVDGFNIYSIQLNIDGAITVS
jgi:hypothetical protein